MGSMVVSCLLLIPLLSSYICIICLIYDPPDANEEDFYGPVDHAINRFKKCFGLHVYCYRNGIKIIDVKILIQYQPESETFIFET